MYTNGVMNTPQISTFTPPLAENLYFEYEKPVLSDSELFETKCQLPPRLIDKHLRSKSPLATGEPMKSRHHLTKSTFSSSTKYLDLNLAMSEALILVPSRKAVSVCARVNFHILAVGIQDLRKVAVLQVIIIVRIWQQFCIFLALCST